MNASYDSEGSKPIQVRAEALRRWEPSRLLDMRRALALMPDDAVEGEDDKVQPVGHWRDADLRRVIDVANEAGLRAYRVEIAPDGTISIIVGEQA